MTSNGYEDKVIQNVCTTIGTKDISIDGKDLMHKTTSKHENLDKSSVEEIQDDVRVKNDSF